MSRDGHVQAVGFASLKAEKVIELVDPVIEPMRELEQMVTYATGNTRNAHGMRAQAMAQRLLGDIQAMKTGLEFLKFELNEYSTGKL